jgi:hypothetical protein
MCVMGTEKKQHYRHTEQEFLSRRVLSAIVDLFPHIEIVVSASVKFKGYTSDPMEHEEGAEHVGDVR